MADVAAVSSTPIVKQWRKVEWFRECPHCYVNHGGVGVCASTIQPDPNDNHIGRRYYKCDTCGNGFTRDFEVAYEMVTKRVVNVIMR